MGAEGYQAPPSILTSISFTVGKFISLTQSQTFHISLTGLIKDHPSMYKVAKA